MKATILKHYPLTLAVVAVICYLSFFTPPKTDLNEVPNIDKLVHICMYGGLSSVIWWEYLRHHTILCRRQLIIGCAILPACLSGCIEILQATCTTDRSGDWRDFIANCIGIALAWLFGNYVLRKVLKR